MSNSLERGLEVLELLAERGEIRLGELAREVNVSRATAFRVLATLQNRGYVKHSRSDRSYRLGSALRALAARSDVSSVVSLAAPAMEQLRAATSETVNLALVRRRRVVYASILEGVHALRMSATVGEAVPVHAAAIGKAVLAHLPPEQRATFLGPEPFPALTKRTPTRTKELEEELDRVKARGYAEDDEEVEVGAACVAAPILDSHGLPVGAMSVSGLAARLPKDARAMLGRDLRRWCDQISRQLGFEEARADAKSIPDGEAPPDGRGRDGPAPEGGAAASRRLTSTTSR